MKTNETDGSDDARRALLAAVEAVAEQAPSPYLRAELTAAAGMLHANAGRANHAVEWAEKAVGLAREVESEHRRPARTRTLIRAAQVLERVRGVGAGSALLSEALDLIEAGNELRVSPSPEERKALERWFAVLAESAPSPPSVSALATRAFGLLERMAPDPAALLLGASAQALVRVGLRDRARDVAQRLLASGGRLLALEHVASALEEFGEGRLDLEDARRLWSEVPEQAHDVDKFALPMLRACLRTEPETSLARVEALSAKLKSTGFTYAAFFVELAGLEPLTALQGADAARAGFEALFATACCHPSNRPILSERSRMLGALRHLAPKLLGGVALEDFTRSYHDHARLETDPSVRTDFRSDVAHLLVERAAPDALGSLESLANESLADLKANARDNRLVCYLLGALEQVVDGVGRLGDRTRASAIVETVAAAARETLSLESGPGAFYGWRTLLRCARAKNRLGEAKLAESELRNVLDRIEAIGEYDRVELLEFAVQILPELARPARDELARRVVRLVGGLLGMGELGASLALDVLEKLVPVGDDMTS